MKEITFTIFISAGSLLLAKAQSKKDTIQQKDIEAVSITVKKPTIESKVDRTVFNVANSSILAGNTTWDVLRMTPLVSIDNNDNIKAEGERVTVYINDRKSVFTGKELKEYLATIPADNLMKIEIITSPSSRYEAAGTVINIVLKKRDDEGIKGSLTLNNRQNRKNSQYTNFNLNYHKKKFTQTLIGSYSDNTWVQSSSILNSLYENNDITRINTLNTDNYKSPSISSTSEFELNDKNNIGLILEYYQSKILSSSDAEATNYTNDTFQYSYDQNQRSNGLNRTLGTNLFYKYYDKEKNKILDINLGTNYSSQNNTNDFIKSFSNQPTPDLVGISSDNQARNYYLKIDYTQPLGESGGKFEVGGKMDFNNNVVPYDLSGNQLSSLSSHDTFHYQDNINSLYANYSQTLFKKLEARIGLRYEYMTFKVRQDIANTSRKDAYGTFLPNLLLKYSFSNQYDLSLTYNRNIWRPWYMEFNPFLLPNNDGIYSRGNLNLQPNPSDRLYMKLGILKKYFISGRYVFTNQDYWTTYKTETTDSSEKNRTIAYPENFNGKVHRYSLFANTNQTFLKNKLNVNVGLSWNYIDNSDFNERNHLRARNYISYWGASANLSYTNLLNKNINLSAWVEVVNQNNGNSLANRTNVFHNISMTKIFPKTQMEVSLQLMNIFQRPNFDATTFSPVGTFRNSTQSDWYGFSLSFVKRFGNQKVKSNTKTDVEKNSGGEK